MNKILRDMEGCDGGEMNFEEATLAIKGWLNAVIKYEDEEKFETLKSACEDINYLQGLFLKAISNELREPPTPTDTHKSEAEASDTTTANNHHQVRTGSPKSAKPTSDDLSVNRNFRFGAKEV